MEATGKKLNNMGLQGQLEKLKDESTDLATCINNIAEFVKNVVQNRCQLTPDDAEDLASSVTLAISNVVSKFRKPEDDYQKKIRLINYLGITRNQEKLIQTVKSSFASAHPELSSILGQCNISPSDLVYERKVKFALEVLSAMALQAN